MTKGILVLLSKIGAAFKTFFASFERVWKKLDPLVKDALLYGSGIIAVINRNLTNDPTAIVYFIQGLFPNLSEGELKVILNKAAQILGIASGIEDSSLLKTIENIVLYLVAKKGKEWAFASDSAAKAIAVAKAPAETKYAVIASLITPTYHKYFYVNDKEVAA